MQKDEYKGVEYVTYKLNDKMDQIVIDKVGEVGKGFDDMVGNLPEKEPRYAVVEVKVTTSDDRETSKLVFLTWIPDGIKVRQRMVYAGSKATLQADLDGIGIVINANDLSDLDYETVVKPEVLKFV